MRRQAALGFAAAVLAVQFEAVAASDCFSLSAYPAAAPVEPGEPAALLTVTSSRPLDGLSVKLFDAQGSEVPIFVDAQSSGETLFLRSTTRLEPGDYVVEYTHACNGSSLIPLSLNGGPPKPPDAPKPGDERKGCECRSASMVSSSATPAAWIVFAAVFIALRRRTKRP